MDALILADRSAQELDQLTPDSCFALLPIGSRPMIELSLDELADAGIERCWIACSAGSLALRSHLEEGDRWGLSIKYVLTRGDEPLNRLLNRLDGELENEALIVEVNRVRERILPRFLELSSPDTDFNHLSCRANGTFAGLSLVRRRASSHRFELSEMPRPVDIAGVTVRRVDSPASYHRISLDCARIQVQEPHLESDLIRPGLRVGSQSLVPDSASSGAHVLAGSRCVVHPEAELHGSVVLTRDILVDRSACLVNTVVLPGTYVPRGVSLENALIAKSRVLALDSGELLDLEANLESCDSRVNPLVRSLRRFATRLGGLALLLLSLPLWPLMLIAGMATGRGPLEHFHFVGCRRIIDSKGRSAPRLVKAWRGTTGIPVLRGLPLLYSVVRGDLDLIGVRPHVAGVIRETVQDWQRPGATARPGLLAAAVIDLPTNRPGLHKEMMDSLFAVQQTAPGKAALLIRAAWSLILPRTWRAAP